jgi:hypothetical protein
MDLPWTRAELNQLLPKIEASIAEIAATQEEPVKGLPPLTSQECLDLFFRILDIAATRPLTQRECFIHGQLLAQYKGAIIAETLGKPGRYYVVSEEEVIGKFEVRK